MSKIEEDEIRRRLKILSQIEPTAEASHRATERVRDTLANTEKRRVSTRIWRAIIKMPITKLAAAAILLIGLGYVAGRLSAPPPDMKQLRSDIYQSVLEQVNRDRQSALTNIRLELKDELNQELRRDLNEFGVRILAASATLTEQRIIELIELIEAARARDRQLVAAALEKIEFDKSQLGKGLVALAAKTSELHVKKPD